jgi:hypothetical protein
MDPVSLLQVLIAVGGTALVAWQDAKTSFMDERVLYGMVVLGLLLLLPAGLPALTSAATVAAVIFSIGYFAYRTGQLGGGDVWLFTALALLVPVRPDGLSDALGTLGILFPPAAFTPPYPFVVSIASASAALGMLGAVGLYVGRMPWNKTRLENAVFLAGSSLLFGGLAWAWISGFPPGAVLLSALVGFPALFFSVYRSVVRREVIVQPTRISDILDEDVLDLDRLPPAWVARYGLERVVTADQLARLRALSKAEGVRTFPICRVLPRFGPYILLSLVLSLLAGDLFVYLLVR